jgi:AcrR family transcriptional regulator
MPVSAKQSKGERTAARILDAAERLFAERGFEGTSLREIARLAELREPGIYNYFAGKQALYAAVLDRALRPMIEAMEDQLRHPDALELNAALPGVMTDLLAAHPMMAALFQQALQGDEDSVGHTLIKEWLDRLVSRGMETMDALKLPQLDRRDMAIRVIAMFNLTTGYFLSQRILETLVAGKVTDPENIERQKRLLSRFARSSLAD